MSATVDQRIVEMRFDNQHFESNVQTSMSSLDKLKQSLNLQGASKGLENVSAAAKNCDMSGLSGAVEAIHTRFTALEVMGVTALANIANSALNTGKKIVSALTIDPIKTGLTEYETKMNAIQTIMTNTASKGTTLDDVNKGLGELNEYADKTIYNFAEMTRNVGTFTASGVELQPSIDAIKGIANLAAGSGSTAQQASNAMYQLSQALAEGRMSLQSWNSVTNAGMGGELFQHALIDKAVELGEMLPQTAEEIKNGNIAFREAIKAGAKTPPILNITKDMMVAVFNDFANDPALVEAATKVKTFTQLWDTLKESAQSGWAQSWELIVGDFEEAKALMTEISETIGGIIGASANARNEVLQGWKDLGGRTALIDALRNSFEGIVSIVTPIKQAFSEIFPPITAKQLVAFSEGLRNLTSHLKLSDETSANLKSTFKGVFAVLDIVKQGFSAVFNAVSPLLGGLGNLGGGILGVTASFGNWLVNLDETLKKTNAFNVGLQAVTGFLGAVVTSIKNFILAVKEKFDFPGFDIFHSFLERVHGRMSQVGEAAGSMKSGVTTAVDAMGNAVTNSKFLGTLQTLWDGVKTVAGGISTALGGMMSGLIKALGNADFSTAFDIIGGLSLGSMALAISNFLGSVTGPLEGLTGILDGVRGCFEAYQTQLKADALLKIAGAIAILTASILVISLIDSDKLAASLGAVTVLFADLMTSMAIFGKISGELTGVVKACTAMIGISVAVLILAGALKTIGELNLGQLATGLVGILGLTATLVAAAKILGSGSGAITKGAAQMVIFAAAVKILASACADLSTLSWNQLTKGLVGVGVLLTEISLFLQTAKFDGNSIATATGIVILAAAIKILASACADFGKMDWGQIGKGLAAIGGLLAEITIFTNLTGNAKRIISTGVALIAIGAAMKIFASALTDFGKLKWDEIARGLTAMAGALLLVTASINFMPKNMVGIGAGLIAVSTALLILATALDEMGDMQWDEIARGLVALGGSMAILAICLHAMNGTLAGSAAMLVAVGALAVLTPILSILGAMSWESIAKGIVSIAGAFAVIGVAGLVLTPIVPAILALGGALALIGLGALGIGAGLLAAGAGLSALAIGVTALVTSVAGGATAIVAALTVIITGVAGLIPTVIGKIGEGIIELCGVITNGVPAIGAAVKAIILTLVDVLVECVPAIADGALKLISGVLAALVEYTPQIVDSIFQFLIGLLDGIAKNLPGLIKAAINVIMAFFSGVVDALSGIDTEVLLKGIVGVGLLSGIMVALGAVASLVPGAMLGVLGMGAIIAELALVLAAVGALAQLPGISWLIGEGGKLLEGIGVAIGSFIGGIVGGFMSGISGQFPQIGSDLSAFMINAKPFIEGAKSIDAATMSGVRALAEVILVLTAANVLEGLTSWFTGKSSMAQFGAELAAFGPYFNAYYESIKGIDGSVVTASANAAKSLAEMAHILPNSGGVVGWFTGENSLAAFAEELTEFGPKLKAYADSVKGLDSSVVVNSANAAKALAEMANNLPNSGGVVGWFMGENDLSSFAEELVEFGPILKEYAEGVRGLDPNVITNSANAAKAIAEMSTNLPNQGGVVSWFTGDNRLSIFGQELAVFGPSLKAYADSLAGLDGAIVTNSTNAAMALAGLANNLPNQGGMVSWFTGDNDIATFGASLVSFGQNFSTYSGYMSNVDAGILTVTTNAAHSIVELQKSLPKDGGWFSGNMSLADFGNDMSLFGCYFSGYYGYISGINTAQLSAVITETSNLISLARGMSEIDTDGMSTFGASLTTLGQMGIDGFISTFTGAEESINTAVSIMLETFITAINDQQPLFSGAGQGIMDAFIEGAKLKETLTTNTLVQMVGRALIAVKNKYVDFYNAGAYVVAGFVAGIADNMQSAIDQAKAMADAVANAAAGVLEIASPSKVGYRIGDFFGIGFVNAIRDNISKSYDAGAEIAGSAKSGLSKTISKITDFISGGIDAQPTIRPVLDLSSVESGASKLNSLFSTNQAMSISAGMNQQAAEGVQNGGIIPGNSSSYSFTQNNYSPKPLSRLEIYRQTKNQFSAMKGLVHP